MKIIITAGGTSEPIDKVRNITNMSTGRLGRAIAHYASKHPEIEKIYFLSPIGGVEGSKIQLIRTASVNNENDPYNLHDTLHNLLTTEKISTVIHAMAVSDYTVDHVFTLRDMATALLQYQDKHGMITSTEQFEEWMKKGEFRMDNSSKISSDSPDIYIKLKQTEKVISKIKEWDPSVCLVGFKLLENVPSSHLLEVAAKLRDKNSCDFVFANDIKKIQEIDYQGFLVLPNDTAIESRGISEIAKAIVDSAVLGKYVQGKPFNEHV